MAATPEAICNQALSWLGGSLITDITVSEDSNEWRLCSANYEPLRDAVLTEYEWTFAVTRITPAAATDPANGGFSKAFTIPATALRVLQVTSIVEENTASSATGLGRYSKVEWLREGDLIMVNGAESIYARVIQQVTDTTKFSPAFDQALAARIAMDIALPLTNSRLLQRDMASLYGEKLRVAASIDGLQGRSTRTRSDSLIRVR